MILGLAFLFASFVDSFGQSKEPSPSRGDAGKPQQEQEQPQPTQQESHVELRGTEQAPIIIRSIKSKEETARDAKDRDNKASAEWWNEVFSAAVAIGTLLQFSALVVIIRTTRRQLRAYIGVSLKRAPELNVGTVPMAILNYKNCGQTPARDVRHWANMIIEPYPSTPRFEPKPLQSERITVNPADTENIIVGLGGTLTQTGVDTIRNDTARFYVYGEFWYFDIFGYERRTEFRLMYGGQEMIGVQGMIRCAKGNSAT